MNHPKITKEDVAPELREYIIDLPNWVITNTIARKILGKLRFLVIGKVTFDDVTIEELTTPEGVEFRLYKPQKRLSEGALLWIHGGGMVTGDPKDNDIIMGETARSLGIIIVAPRYRHAPEYRFPAHLDDSFAAWQWLLDSAEVLQIDKNRLAIGGQSAGGGLTASLVQKIYDLGGVQPVAQWLYCPMLDDRTATQKELDSMNHFIWNNHRNRFGWSAYLGVEAGATNVPTYSVPARREDLRGFPPTWIGIGDIDLFYEEDKKYAERLRAAGVEVTFDEVPKAYHGFEILAIKTPMAQAFLKRSREWLRMKLNEGGKS
jgi:acetyl esterase/lipase